MEILIETSQNWAHEECQEMYIDGQEALSVYPLNECPEDAIIGRSLISCEEVVSFMKQAYEAGKKGEELTVKTQEASEE